MVLRTIHCASKKRFPLRYNFKYFDIFSTYDKVRNLQVSYECHLELTDSDTSVVFSIFEANPLSVELCYNVPQFHIERYAIP